MYNDQISKNGETIVLTQKGNRKVYINACLITAVSESGGPGAIVTTVGGQLYEVMERAESIAQNIRPIWASES